ncbi:hypothetical protein HMPREF0281_00700 [Corynebacterium ammoniagenes DSM 20306]|uniref:Uncharacterized protein n=1 Tax=Corynebacterium ammoniagenes DSM 20306 TaxID=649754 RepID=A0ABN0AGP8_CORAM|nr:hypothetical protein HMPREF0281_00700 [Corynebacterium ammoniagenes DSM 20306]
MMQEFDGFSFFYPCATGGRLWRAATNIVQSLTHAVTPVYQSG